MAGGFAEGGAEAVQRYYADSPDILQREQLFGESSYTQMTTLIFSMKYMKHLQSVRVKNLLFLKAQTKG